MSRVRYTSHCVLKQVNMVDKMVASPWISFSQTLRRFSEVRTNTKYITQCKLFCQINDQVLFWDESSLNLKSYVLRMQLLKLPPPPKKKKNQQTKTKQWQYTSIVNESIALLILLQKNRTRQLVVFCLFISWITSLSYWKL